jgi:translation elongation factor EF-G
MGWVDVAKLPLLREGLRLLSQADPSADVTIDDAGQHILATAGELHLEVHTSTCTRTKAAIGAPLSLSVALSVSLCVCVCV